MEQYASMDSQIKRRHDEARSAAVGWKPAAKTEASTVLHDLWNQDCQAIVRVIDSRQAALGIHCVCALKEQHTIKVPASTFGGPIQIW